MSISTPLLIKKRPRESVPGPFKTSSVQILITPDPSIDLLTPRLIFSGSIDPTKGSIEGRRDQSRGRNDQSTRQKDQLRGRGDQSRGRRDQLRGRNDQSRGRRDQLRGRNDQSRGRRDQSRGRRDQSRGRRRSIEGSKDQSRGRNPSIERQNDQSTHPEQSVDPTIGSIEAFRASSRWSKERNRRAAGCVIYSGRSRKQSRTISMSHRASRDGGGVKDQPGRRAEPDPPGTPPEARLHPEVAAPFARTRVGDVENVTRAVACEL